MTLGPGSLLIQTSLHPTNGWILIRLSVSDTVYEMVLDTGSPLSSISVRMRDLLADGGLLEPAGGNWYLLRSLSIDGQPIADLRVRLSRRVMDVGADGVLGLDFLQRFREICFDVPTLTLSLRS